MKRAIFFLGFGSLLFVLLLNSDIFTPALAQGISADTGDRQLAAEIGRLTDQREGNAVINQGSRGIVADLNDGFQTVALARLGEDDHVDAFCVTNVAEAGAFFGRDLVTGQTMAKIPLARSSSSRMAAEHGMSEAEFLFYSKLIEDAQRLHADSPDTATITILNNDGPDEGFNDNQPAFANPEGNNTGSTRGQQRLNVFNFAAGIWGAFLDTNVPIVVRSQMDAQTCSTAGAVLGSAGTVTRHRDFTGAPSAGTWYSAALANKLSGADLGADPEINATFNVAIDTGCLAPNSRWYYGLDNSVPSLRINLLVVLLHEMGHGLGFQAFANGQTGALFSGLPDQWSRMMYDEATGQHWDAMTGPQRQASAISNTGLRWDGPSVLIGGTTVSGCVDTQRRVQLYAPGTFTPGSSVSHYNTSCSPNLLMEPSINNGLPINLDLTRQLMRDIGWYRDADLDNVADTITNVTPAGGFLIAGSTATMNWVNNGLTQNVTVELSQDNGATYPTALATNVVNVGTLQFVVPSTLSPQSKIRVREAGFASPQGVSGAFAITNGPLTAPFDFDGDARTDLSIFRPGPAEWWYARSSDGATRAFQFGAGTDTVAPADFTGDGKTDVAFFRPANGQWFVLRSEDSSFFSFPFGASGDVPVPADFDADGKADAAVFRPSTATWYIAKSTGGTDIIGFGAAGDVPVTADYDGDAKADMAIYRPNAASGGEWWIRRSSNASILALQFGNSTDRTVQGDYTGDGKADIAFFRPSNGNWFILRSEDLSFFSFPFGATGDIPVAGDYDGDGKNDAAVFRPTSSTWFANKSNGGTLIQQFGAAGDVPLPSSFVR